MVEGTPVLLANGTSRRIEQLPNAGGVRVFGPTQEKTLAMARQREMIPQGTRECVSLVLQDGRRLTCTPDHKVLRSDGRWVRADRLVLGKDRVLVGLEAPLDDVGDDDAGYVLTAGDFTFSMETAHERARTLAFARLVGHLICDGSISVLGQGRMNVGQALDRQAALDDIELLTGKRPAGTRYDERKWSIALPQELTDAIIALPGVRVGRRIEQPASLPAFVLDDGCPVSVVREFLGGVFGADGHAPSLHRTNPSKGEDGASLRPTAFSQTAKPEHIEALKQRMRELLIMLGRCGVRTKGAWIGEYAVRRSSSTYPAPREGVQRREVRLQLTHGLSFVERVGYRYCVDKTLRASAAAAYWRMIDGINRQRLWMADRLEEMHTANQEVSFNTARALAATELTTRETPVFPHYSLLEGHDRFDRLPSAETKFKLLHRESCGFPSPAAFFEQIGARSWFAALQPRSTAIGEMDQAIADVRAGDAIDESSGGDCIEEPKSYCIEKESLEAPTFSLAVVDRRDAGVHPVYDIAVDDINTFVAATVLVRNCIGNAGPLPDEIATALQKSDVVACSVLSGNRNFEGRIHPQVKMNFLASPPLVVAYAIAGSMKLDLYKDPLGIGSDGKPVYLRDIWPSSKEIHDLISKHVTSTQFKQSYASVFDGDANWKSVATPTGEIFTWDEKSTYVKHPPYFEGMSLRPGTPQDIKTARVLAMLGDSVTTDHISPAGNIAATSPAAKYLESLGVQRKDFNSYGARRGNDRVMVRGTFANIRLKNLMVPGVEGGVTVHQPTQ
ncbi:MAG TPA: aconitase family protein, partial [Rhodanobacteraceae bacterium]|nr:aconitase family protein [Rhodanobacteraceae bacterium]